MKISSIAIGFLSVSLLCGGVSAQETDYNAGTKALPLQQNGGDARAAAMGSAVVAVPQGAASLLWNPAGLSRMRCGEFGVHHNTGLGDTIQEIAIYGMPLGEVKPDEPGCEGKGGSLGGIAASFGYVNYGSFSGRDINGLPTDNFHSAEYSGSLGWGIEFLPNVSAGIVLKADRSDLANKNYDAYATDVGFSWKVIPALDLGAAYSNINLGKRVGDANLVSGWRLGAGYTLGRHLILAASGELQEKAMKRAQVGTEYLIGNTNENSNILALRAGYQLNYPNPQLDGVTGVTFGLGYTLTRSLALDYALVPVGDLGTTHRVSLTYKFNCPKRQQQLQHQPIVIKSFLLEDSHFDFDKATLRPEGMKALRENIQLLKDNPEALVRIAGYTSMRGTAEYNQLLSERRAAAVEQFLVTEGGIAPRRITTVGYGATHPATYEAAPRKINSAAAKSNMRVLFEVTVK